MKSNALLFAVAIVLSSIIFGYAVINRNRPQGTVNVTGLGEKNFTSDLIVWEGNFSRSNSNIQSAYANLEKDREAVTQYLISKGIPEEQ
nr:SIMPL domain-containing protein [Algoriphagus aquimaris]